MDKYPTQWRKDNKPLSIRLMLALSFAPFITIFLIGVLLNGSHF